MATSWSKNQKEGVHQLEIDSYDGEQTLMFNTEPESIVITVVNNIVNEETEKTVYNDLSFDIPMIEKEQMIKYLEQVIAMLKDPYKLAQELH